ncbi:hypothetical protein [Azospirillum canadense]|uniref:hypothetical protein n=1 Tax=Azospirillum canadense TaxID=403962 RepID=UPI002226FB28|nr:hypothetical protein [Azospirillum canadense]MCW2240662.1 outer membrane lipoprotein SlyB [Azospirillum canadense]
MMKALHRGVVLATLVCGACADGVVTGPAVSSRYAPAPQSATAAVGGGNGAATATQTAMAGRGTPLTVSTAIWFALTDRERAMVRDRFDVDVSERVNYGTIIDVQGVDESTSGTASGSALGGALGSAMYVDNAFKGPSVNYSATSHLGAVVLGSMIGTSMDRPAQRSFRFRYTVKDSASNVSQFDRVSPEPFHQPAGACVEVASLTVVASSYCAMDLLAFRKQYLPTPSTDASVKGRKAKDEDSRS